MGINPQELNNIISLNENFQNLLRYNYDDKKEYPNCKNKTKKKIDKSIKDISNILILYINRIEDLSNKKKSQI